MNKIRTKPRHPVAELGVILVVVLSFGMVASLICASIATFSWLIRLGAFFTE